MVPVNMIFRRRKILLCFYICVIVVVASVFWLSTLPTLKIFSQYRIIKDLMKSLERISNNAIVNTVNTADTENYHEKILDEQRKRRENLEFVCTGLTHTNRSSAVNVKRYLSRRWPMPRLYYSDNHKFVICGVPKCGSTEWRRAILMVEAIVNVTSPEEIDHELAFTLAHRKRFLWDNFPPSNPKSFEELNKRLNSYFRVMMVREPLDRVVSAYIDKMLPGGTAVEMYKQMSHYIHRRFAKDKKNFKEGWATFEEFVENILAAPGQLDIHWQQYSAICDPCNMHYDFIAKLETIEGDSSYLSEKTGIDHRLLFNSTATRCGII